MTRRSVAFAAVLAALTMAPVARAQAPGEEANAAQFFRAGLAAYDRHEFRAAALAFEEAYARAPRGAAIYNAARGWEAAGEQARAADAFAAALSHDDLDPQDAQVAREHLAALAPKFGVVGVTAPGTAAVTVDGTDRGHGPRNLHVLPGGHDVRVTRRDASVVDRPVTVAAGETVSIAVDDVPPASAVVAPPPADAARGASADRGTSTWAWIALGTTVVLAAGGTATYVKFTSDRSSFDAGGDTNESLHASATTFRTVTYVLWGAAAAGVIASAVLFAIRKGPASSTALRFAPAWVSGSF
jgi:hypothetical protein